MAKRQMSAKDIAHKNELNKYRKTINELEIKLNESENSTSKRIAELEEENQRLEDLVREKEEWIDRLLEYSELTRDELRAMFENEKKKSELMENVSNLFGMAGSIPGSYFG